jgi:hypothetical protein
MSRPIVRFGVIADPQYAAIAPWRDRYFAQSLEKLEHALGVLDGEDLAFVVTLCDVIDRDWASFAPALAVYRRARHPQRFVLGNHDFAVAPERLPTVKGVLGLERGHYAFAVGDVRFLVVDGTEVSVFAHSPGSDAHARAAAKLAELEAAEAINAQPWNGGIGAAQKAWLAAELAGADARSERVVVLSHYPVFPRNDHNLWNETELVSLLAASPSVLAHLSGHNHEGNYGVLGGKHFLNLKGMVETRDQTAFAIVEVHGDRLEVQGFGREPSRSLPV